MGIMESEFNILLQTLYARAADLLINPLNGTVSKFHGLQDFSDDSSTLLTIKAELKNALY